MSRFLCKARLSSTVDLWVGFPRGWLQYLLPDWEKARVNLVGVYEAQAAVLPHGAQGFAKGFEHLPSRHSPESANQIARAPAVGRRIEHDAPPVRADLRAHAGLAH